MKSLSLILLSSFIVLAACGEENNQNQEQSQGQSQGERATSVNFITIKPVSISMTNELPGRVVSYQVAEIRPQVSGIVQSRLFEEGSFVEEGQQLYQIEPERYQADYEMAQASLQDARARVKNAKNLVDRYSGLIDSNAVSGQEYDNAKATLDQAQAAVSLAQAEVKTAKINLDYTKVYAPISGYISPSGVTKGALVTAQQENALATIRQLDPVYVDLSQAAVEAKNFQERLMRSRMNKSDKAEYEVTLYMGSTGETYPHKGKLDATDLAVDMQTGSIRLRSVFPNPDIILLPGMFVRASIEDAGQSKEIVIPQKAARINPDGEKTVWVIDAQNKAEQRNIRTGATYENNWVVLSGLEVGDKVITDGTMMLRPGALVEGEEIDTGLDRNEDLEASPNIIEEKAVPLEPTFSPPAETPDSEVRDINAPESDQE